MLLVLLRGSSLGISGKRIKRRSVLDPLGWAAVEVHGVASEPVWKIGGGSLLIDSTSGRIYSKDILFL